MRIDYSKTRATPSKAIRLKCLDCCGDQVSEVRDCTIKSCPLWRYRMGREERDELYARKTQDDKTAENTDDFEQGGDDNAK